MRARENLHPPCARYKPIAPPDRTKPFYLYHKQSRSAAYKLYLPSSAVFQKIPLRTILGRILLKHSDAFAMPRIKKKVKLSRIIREPHNAYLYKSNRALQAMRNPKRLLQRQILTKRQNRNYSKTPAASFTCADVLAANSGLCVISKSDVE